MSTKQILGGVGIALIVLGLCFLIGGKHANVKNPLTGATNQCASGQTCLPSFEFTGATGGVTNTLQIDAGITAIAGALNLTSTLQVGASGTSLNNVIQGKCVIWAPSQTIVASSSQDVSCQSGTGGTLTPISGVQKGDTILANNSTTTAGIAGTGVEITGVSASTTNGYIEMTIGNSSGTTFTWTAAASSGVSFIDLR